MSNDAIVFGSSWVVRLGIKQVLRRVGLNVAADGDDFGPISQLAITDRPAIIIGLAVTPYDRARLVADMCLARTTYPGAPGALVVSTVTPEALDDASRARADGLLCLTMPSKLLLSSLELIVHGQKLFPGIPQGRLSELDERAFRARPDSTSGFADAPEQLRLAASLGCRTPSHTGGESLAAAPSEREWQILNCLASGGSNKAIARELGIAETTVKVHVKSLLRKLRLANRTQAAVWVHNNQRPATASISPPSADFSRSP